MNYQNELALAKKIARKAGDVMLEYFDADQDLDHKDDGTVVTIADKTINRMVIEEIGKNLNDGVIGEEESTAEYGPGRKWICDPIDGTKAFVVGVPTSTFSLALAIDGLPVLGVVYDPYLDRLYWGIKGQGSYCNDKELKVSNNPIKGHYVGVSSGNTGLVDKGNVIKQLLNSGAKLDTTHGAVYKSCLVAHGRTVGYIEPRVNPHDVAAIHLIVEEAGGKVTGYRGEKLDYTKHFYGVIVSNGKVHDELLRCIEAG
ncbi:MAG TPA: inositol monophosphatase [Candidatus Saccharimonadales bacterium]|nr:inositol monophosphatase [Candidatus Saccharimonadales bacterium]